MSFTRQKSQKGPWKSTGALFVFWQPSSTVLRQTQKSTTRAAKREKIPGVDSRQIKHRVLLLTIQARPWSANDDRYRVKANFFKTK